MSKRLTPEQLRKLLASANHKVLRALLHRQCHDSLEAFCRTAWTILHPDAPFPSSPYILAMIHELQQLVTGDVRRLANSIPPRHGKTEFGTIMLAAWILGRDPAAKIFVVSYGMDLSESLTDKVRTILLHPAYKRMFPKTRLKVGANRKDHFHTTARGECMAASQSSAITGFGTHYLLIDDYQKADDALSPVQREAAISSVRNTLLSRFDNMAEGRILINQQRLHEDDLTGWAIGIGWRQFKLPAIATENTEYTLPNGRIWHRKKGDLLDPIRVPQSYLDEQLLAQGHRFFEAQYQQNPGAAYGRLFNWNWFGQYDEMPERKDILYIVQSWDPASSEEFTADWSVGMTWGFDGENWLLLDLIRVRLRFSLLLDRVCSSHKRWKADALIIEGGSLGDSLCDQAKTRGVPGYAIAPLPRGSKEDRAATCTALLETGRFLLPAAAPFIDDFRHELLAFPDGKHDDQVDALTQFLHFVLRRKDHIEGPRDAQGRPIRIRRSRPRSYRD